MEIVACPSAPGLAKLMGFEPRFWYVKSELRFHVVEY
jgi:hypothetical protein